MHFVLKYKFARIFQMKNPVSDGIRRKVGELMKELGVKKTRFGEILGESGKEEVNQQKYLRADRFLRSTSEIGVDRLIKVADFFGKPISFFLTPVLGLSASEKRSGNSMMPISEIEKNLRKMGLDEEYIKNEIEQLKAMELYKTMHR